MSNKISKHEVATFIYAAADDNGYRVKYSIISNPYYEDDYITIYHTNWSGVENFINSNKTNLTYIKVDKLNNTKSNPTTFFQLFRSANKLEEIDFSGVDCSEVTTTKSMCNSCSKLKKVNIGDFSQNIYILNDFSFTFTYCTSLKYIDISDIRMDRVTSISSLFWRCVNLEHIIFHPKLNLNYCENYSYTFGGCTKLESVNTENFVGTNITNITSMFMDCSALLYINLRNFRNTQSSSYNSANAFKGCTLVKYAKVKDAITATFFNNTSGSNVTFSAYSPSTKYGIAYTYYNTSGTLVSSYIEYNTFVGVKNFCYNSYYKPNFKTITIIRDTTSVETINLNGFFKEFPQLEVVDLSLLGGVNCTDIGFLCQNSPKLRKFTMVDTDITNRVFNNVTIAEGAFSGCDSITYLNVSQFNIKKLIKGRGIFYGCSDVEYIEGLNNWDFSNTTELHELFYGCSKLKSMYLKNVNFSEVTSFYNFFNGCEQMEKMGIHPSHPTNTNIFHYFLNGCNNIKHISLGAKFKIVTLQETGDMTCIFRNCHALEELHINTFLKFDPRIYSITFIDAFQNSNQLKRLYIHPDTWLFFNDYNVKNVLGLSNNVEIIRTTRMD